MATLIFYLDDGREIAVPLDGRIKVGSTEGNDVLVEDAGVSPRHAEITHTPSGGYHLRDLGSESGTIVNGDRVVSRDLQHGDEVSFGRLRGRFFLHENGDALSSEEEGKKKLQGLRDAYNDTFTKHTTLFGVVTSLANQERQKLASLDRLQTDTLNLETRIANARGILSHLEDSITKAAENISQKEARHQEVREKVEKQTNLAEQLNLSVAKLENDKLALERTLGEIAEKRKESETKRDQADAEATQSRAEQQSLTANLAVLTKKHSDALASLHEQELKSTSLTKSLEDFTRRLADETDKHGRLTIERQRLEQDLVALKSNESKARDSIAQLEKQQASLATNLREREATISLADITLTGLLEKHSKSNSETESLRAEKAQAEIEISRLGNELSKLQSSVLDMETRQTAGLELLRQRQDQVRSANENLDALKASESKAQEKVAHLENQQAALTAALLEREDSVTRADSDLSALQQKHRQTESEINALREVKVAYEADIARLGVDLNHLRGSFAEAELQKTIGQELVRQVAALRVEETKAHDSIAHLKKQQDALSAALREREENIARADSVLSALQQKHRQTELDFTAQRALIYEHQSEIARLVNDLNLLRNSVAEVESQKTAGLELVRQRQDQVRSANESLVATRAAHQAEILSQEESLNAMLKRLHAAEAQLKESIAKNEILAQQNQKLDEVRAQIQSAENKRAQMTTENLRLEEQTAKLNSSLIHQHRELESSTDKLTRLRVDESALVKTIQTLQDNSRAEQQRFDQSVRSHAETNQQAEARHREMESTLESLRGQINKLEAYLTSLEVWKDDMSEQYSRLANIPVDTPEAFKLWREIHQKKGEIATVLPAQTGIKPRFNTQVQVVPRGQRPA